MNKIITLKQQLITKYFEKLSKKITFNLRLDLITKRIFSFINFYNC